MTLRYPHSLRMAVRWRLAAMTLAALLIATEAYAQVPTMPADSTISVNFITGRATAPYPGGCGDGWAYRFRTSSTDPWPDATYPSDAPIAITISDLANPDYGEFQLKRGGDYGCSDDIDWRKSVSYTATTLSSTPATLLASNLHGATLTVMLGDNETTRTFADGASSPETFASGADSSHFGLSITGLTGLTIDSVATITPGGRTATLTLSYTGSVASTVGGSIAVTVAAAAHSGTNVITSKAKSIAADYDTDDNGFIEIRTLSQLNAMRWDLDGDGAVSDDNASNYSAAFSGYGPGMGCPTNNDDADDNDCVGYELMANLDFDENGDDQITATGDPTYWNNDAGWLPIGPYTGQFKGNNRTLSNLFINRATTNNVGLFSAVSGDISGLGLKNVHIRGGDHTGGLVGNHGGGRVTACYVTGRVEGRANGVGGLVGRSYASGNVIAASYSIADVVVAASVSANGMVGGLVGLLEGGATLKASYALGAVVVGHSSARGGGLVGNNKTGSTITGSYAAGEVTGAGAGAKGGFVGDNSGTVTDSYWDSDRSGIDDDNDADAPEGKTTMQLQSPTSYAAIYANWNEDVDGVSGNDDPWTFGASNQYPVLKYAGMDTTTQFATPPTGVMVMAFADSLVVRWTAANNATGYKVQWKSGGASYPATDQQASTHGQATVSGVTTTYAIAMLTNGTTYTVRVLATRAEGDSDPSIEVMGTPGIRYDTDGNGLIEIETLAQLHAMRGDRNGDGAVDSGISTMDSTAHATAFPNATSRMGCPSTGCTGYELTANLTFPASGDYSTWSPINNFNTTLEGNGRTLTDLNVNPITNTNADLGLFGSLGGSAVIRNLGLVNPTVVSSTTTARSHGIVAGYAPSGATISAVYILGGSITTAANNSNAGGLVGFGSITIQGSYSTASVRVSGNPTGVDIGGLVGDLSGGSITASYATGTVSGGTGAIGGLVGQVSGGAITASYCDTLATDQANCNGSGTTVPGKSTTDLQTPTGYTGIYMDWNLDLDGISGNDDPWTFGASDQYPVLKYADMDTTAQFAAQFVPRGVTLTAFEDSLVVRWNAVRNATGYKVQWKSGSQNYPSANHLASTHGQAAVSSGSDTTYAIENLTTGTPYTVRVIATRAGGDSDPSDEVMGTPGIRYDTDGNGLIEIETLAQLHAMRGDRNGDGAVDSGISTTDSTAYATAFPNAASRMGCLPTGCTGYELAANLTFPASGDYSTWSPINNFNTTLEGNGRTLTDLNVNPITNTNADLGLFGSLGGSAVIRNLGLVNPTVVSSTTAARSHGIVAGYAPSGDTISAVYILGGSITTAANNSNAGALIGFGSVTIRASYSTASVGVSGNPTSVDIGGLVGDLSGGSIIASYATGTVSGGTGSIGGLVGKVSGGAITASYCDTLATDQANCNGSGTTVPGKSTTQLQTPTGYTGIYMDWNLDLDGISGNDDPWTFGASDQYPVLKYADMDTTAQFAAHLAAQFAPQGVTLRALGKSLVVHWSPVSSATGYKVQWKSGGERYPSANHLASTHGQATVSSGSDTTYTIANLTTGTPYTVRVIATLQDMTDSGPSSEVMGTPEIRFDTDGDGLIDIWTLAQLNAIRWDLDGNGQVDPLFATNLGNYAAAFPLRTQGCPGGCQGYELMTDLDFSGSTYASDSGWLPISGTTAGFNNSYNTVFEGNGHTISNLFINRDGATSQHVGLFGYTASNARIRNVGMKDANVRATNYIAILVGNNRGTVTTSWSSGTVYGQLSVGGLVGRSRGAITACYSTANVTGTFIGSSAESKSGGLVGWNQSNVTASYSTGTVTTHIPTAVLVGGNEGGTIAHSYWDTITTGRGDDTDTNAPEGKSTSDLQSPTGYTGIYSQWNVNLDGVAGGDDPWAFGTSSQYPVLKYAGMDTIAQFAAQPPGVPQSVTLTSSLDTLIVRWVAVRHATGYKVQWKSGGQNYPSSDEQTSTHGQATVSGGSDTTYTIANLTPGTPYTVRVIATTERDGMPSSEVIGIPSVSIPDAGLRAVIEDSLDKASGAAITPAEMATLTRLIAPSKNIRDLTGLELATGLDTLNLSDNNIEDIEPLVNNAGLGTGAAIDLRGNPLNAQSRDVHIPALEARGVSVQVTPSVSIPDAGLRAVIEDSLDKASGATITRSEMATLTRLIAPNKNISDLTGLEFATGLDTLDLSDNNIEDIEPLVDNTGLGTGAAIDLRGNPLNDQSRDVHIPALEARGVAVHVQPTTNLDIDADGTADLTDAIMVILYLFGLENEGITDYILFSQQATRTNPQAVTAYIETLITTGRVDIDADGTVDLTDIIMVILYLFGLENEGITDYILFSAQAQRTNPQDVTAYIASLLP